MEGQNEREYLVCIANRGPPAFIKVPQKLAYPRLVDAIKREFRLNDALGLELRAVEAEPNQGNAIDLFDSSSSFVVASTEVLLADGVVYIVGKLAEGE